MKKKTSIAWYLLPLLFGFWGGLIGWYLLRKKDSGKAKWLIFIGLFPTIVLFGIIGFDVAMEFAYDYLKLENF